MANEKMKVQAVKEWLAEVKGPKKPIEVIQQSTSKDLVAKFNKNRKR